MKNVLVTGGLGFIGSHTCVELLELGCDLTIIDNLSNTSIQVKDQIKKITGKTFDFINLDLTDSANLDSIFSTRNIEAVIHFAAFKAVGDSVEMPISYYRNNLLSLLNILEMCEKYTVNKLVFSSSCTVYGQPETLPVTESSPKQSAESPYGNTKQICEEIIEDFCRSNKDFKAVSLRYFNPTGAHESALIGELPLGVPTNLVPFITQTAAGLREKLSVFGGDYNTADGTCIRDYIHVVDLAKAHIAALDYTDRMKSNYDFFNVGTGIGYSVLDVINSFEKVSGLKLNYQIVDRRPGDIEKIYADTTKVNDIFGWHTHYDLDDMMKSAWEWQKNLMKK
ncbi:UDP-glucose 4-epimerase GalE [Ekhidna sp. To15]|uniref:UDP-glucose 4-epimerase GalE n=1 Tax=Ekhidna sp. To15 TaxID=3395267 RepID=UPI003F5204BD